MPISFFKFLVSLTVANQEKGGTISWVMGHGSWVMGHGSWVMGHGSFDTWMRQCCGPVIVPEYVGWLATPMIDGALAG